VGRQGGRNGTSYGNPMCKLHHSLLCGVQVAWTPARRKS
jgi:hypothetical protein